MSLNNMVFQYFFEDTSKMSLAMVGSYAPMIIAMALIGKLTGKFGKKKVYLASSYLNAVPYVLIFFIGPRTNVKANILWTEI